MLIIESPPLDKPTSDTQRNEDKQDIERKPCSWTTL